MSTPELDEFMTRHFLIGADTYAWHTADWIQKPGSPLGSPTPHSVTIPKCSSFSQSR